MEWSMKKIVGLTVLLLLVWSNLACFAAETEPKQVKSIKDGFRGIPWGSSIEFMKSLGYLCSSVQASGKTTCTKPGDRKSFGNMDVRSIVCDLSNGAFEAVLMTFDTTETEGAFMNLKNSFGEPASMNQVGKMIKFVWVKGNVSITQTNSTIEIRRHANPILIPKNF